MSDIDKLREMVASYPDIIQGYEDQITSIDGIVTDIDEQILAIENIVMTPLLSASDGYLVQKAIDLGVSECGGTCSYCTSGGYGVSNITEWAIVSGGCPPSPHIVVFKSSDVSPSVDSDQYYRQIDFAEAYGHINDPIDASITYGTYGLLANKSNLLVGKSVVEKNLNKIETIFPIYEQFT